MLFPLRQSIKRHLMAFFQGPVSLLMRNEGFWFLQLETICVLSCFLSRKDCRDCRTHPLQLGLQLRFEQVCSYNNAVSLVPVVWLKAGANQLAGCMKTREWGEEVWLTLGSAAVSRLCRAGWQTQVHDGMFNKDNIISANTSYVGNEWCNFLLLLFSHTFKPFDRSAPQKREKHVIHWRGEEILLFWARKDKVSHRANM